MKKKPVLIQTLIDRTKKGEIVWKSTKKSQKISTYKTSAGGLTVMLSAKQTSDNLGEVLWESFLISLQQSDGRKVIHKKEKEFILGGSDGPERDKLSEKMGELWFKIQHQLAPPKKPQLQRQGRLWIGQFF